MESEDEGRRFKKIQKDIVQFKQVQLNFKDRIVNMVVIKNLTQSILYQKIQLENYLYELFTATMSHEMRTPLNSINSLTQVLLARIKDRKSQQDLRIINSSSEMMNFLVCDMLDLFSMKNKRFQKEEKQANVRDEVQKVISIFKEPCSQKKLLLSLTVEDRVPEFLILDA